jgi:endonuclease/exonuclease/phosphatase family metal-dependent hydrolase
MSRTGRRVLILLLPFLLSLSGTAVRAAPIDLTVMTQNLYIGADTDPVLAAPDLATAVARALQAFDQVQANNFPVRAGAIASEVKAAGGPLLIGLQEASVIKTPAGTLDYAQILVNQLAAVGLNYTIAGIHKDSSVSLPVLPGFSVTDQEVVLARTGVPGFAVTGSEEHTYTSNFIFSNPAISPTPISAGRGYVLVDATLDGVPFQFASTHLEASDLGALYRPAQAAELIGELNTSNLPQLLVGDFNDTPLSQTYQEILAAGFVDTAATVGADGFTCCQAPDLSNQDSLLHNRFDYIFERDFPSILSAFLVGNTPFEDVPPLWPSDHAGVVATVAVAAAVAVPEPSSAGILIVSLLLLSPIVGFGVRARHRAKSAAPSLCLAA